MADPTPADAIAVSIGETVYPVRWSEVTARQVGVIRMMHGVTPQVLRELAAAGAADLPEFCALAHLSRLQAGDRDFDAGALLDTVTLSTEMGVDDLDEREPSIEDADPQP